MNIWIVPFLLIYLIRTFRTQIIALSISLVILIILSPFILFANLALIGIMFSDVGSNQIYEKEISNKQYFSINRKGGGNYFAIDTKLHLGFVKRHELTGKDFEIFHDYQNNLDTIIISNDTVIVDRKLIER